MPNVVRFPARKPAWLYFVAGRLMVHRNRPLRDLHAIAAQLRIPRRMFMRGSGHGETRPYYQLTPLTVRRCLERFGTMICDQEGVIAAAAACRRPNRGGASRVAS